MNNELTQNLCIDCKSELLLKVLKNPETKELIGYYKCSKCGAKWIRDDYFIEIETKQLKRFEEKKEGEINKTVKVAKTILKKGDKIMSVKGKCYGCYRENLTIVAGGLCGKCYYAARKDGKKGKKKVAIKKVNGNKQESKTIEMSAIMIPGTDSKSIRIQFDLQINVSNVKIVE